MRKIILSGAVSLIVMAALIGVVVGAALARQTPPVTIQSQSDASAERG